MVVAGDDGRVAVAWMQRVPGHLTEFSMYVAYTLNAHGSTVSCGGHQVRVPARWSVANASRTPVHRGEICLNGTACNASTDFPAGDRRLGDFYTVNVDAKGRVFVVGASTTQAETTRPTSNPIFIAASSGAPLITHPARIRATRPSCGLNPLC